MRTGSLLLSLLTAYTSTVSANSHERARHAAVNLIRGEPLRGHLGPQASSFAAPTTEGVHPTAIANEAHAGAKAGERRDRDEEWAGATQVVELERRYILPRATAETVATGQHGQQTLPDTRPPAPHIRDTLKAITPLFSAVFHHPLRYSWLLVKLAFRLLWSLVLAALGFVWMLLRPFMVPIYIAVVLPSSFAIAAFGEPLITFLMSATLLGLAIGVVAGYSNGTVSDYLASLPVLKVNIKEAAATPVRARSESSSSPSYGMAYFDPPSRRRQRDDELEEDDADIDADFRESLRFSPMPPPFGRKPRSGDGSGSDEGDDEDGESAPPTPRAGSPVKSRTQPERPGLRHRASTSSVNSTGSIRPALLSPLNERPPRQPKAVRWEE